MQSLINYIYIENTFYIVKSVFCLVNLFVQCNAKQEFNNVIGWLAKKSSRLCRKCFNSFLQPIFCLHKQIHGVKNSLILILCK